MGFDHEAHRAQLLQHYTDLAAQPGWRQYVWAQVKQMALDCPELYRELPGLLTATMKKPEARSMPSSSGSL